MIFLIIATLAVLCVIAVPASVAAETFKGCCETGDKFKYL
jgi:hypothetical protein